MAEVVRMPKLSDTMTEGVVAKWHKKVGDNVSAGDLLADIETDKATMEFESFQEGVLLHQGIEEGNAAPVDSILAILGEKDEDVSKILKEEEKKSKKEEKPTESKQSKEKGEDEKEEAKQEPDKKQQPEPKEQPKQPVQKQETSFSSTLEIKASPLAKKMAEERNINLSLVKGTGDGGRIIRRDIENHISGVGVMPQVEAFDEVTHSQMRKTIARRLSESKYTAPHFYLTMDINMDEVVKARKQINEIASVKISFNDIVIRAASRALQDHPAVNASWQETSIKYNHHVHIGVAIAVDEGLVVPVVKFANTKKLSQIASEVKDFAEKAKSKKLQPTDFQGNTFTISNLGMFGIEEFTAIINPPDSCIMAVGAIREIPVVENGSISVGNRMKVTLSCDHRVVDGATGAQFLNTFKKFLENPVLLLGEPFI